MTLRQTIWSVTEPVLTPGSLMTRFKEWVPCASLADLGNDTMCAPSGCTDSRLSQAEMAWALSEKASQIEQDRKTRKKQRQRQLLMKTEKKN